MRSHRTEAVPQVQDGLWRVALNLVGEESPLEMPHIYYGKGFPVASHTDLISRMNTGRHMD